MNQDQIQKTLMEELGLADLPQDKQEQLLVKMTEVLLKRIFVETMDKLNEQARDEYEKLIDQESTPDQVETFLKTNIPTYESLVQKIIDDFKTEMKSNL
jgi:hypothetical protein